MHIRSVLILSTSLSTFLICSAASAQVDPVDKNFGGPYAGGQVIFGQAYKAGNGSPGAAFLGAADIGFGLKRDTWNRVELGLELATGTASFKDEGALDIDVDIDLNMLVMLKAGYGYSLGGPAFGFFRAGVGMVQSEYEGSSSGVDIDGGSSTGVASMIAWDAVYMASDKLDLIGGASFRIVNFNFKDISDDRGTFQMNIPSVYGGIRWRL